MGTTKIKGAFLVVPTLETNMSGFEDRQIKAWIKNGEHFEQRGDSGGLFLCFRENMALPVWKFRYRFSGHTLSHDAWQLRKPNCEPRGELP
jgi:hypothetical protein